MASVGKIDGRYRSYKTKRLEIPGGIFWKPYGSASNGQTAGAPEKSGVPAGMDADLYEYRPPVDLSNGKLRKLAAALGPAYVGRAAIRLHPEQLFEVDRLALGFQFRSALLGRFHQGLLRGWHSPPRRCE